MTAQEKKARKQKFRAKRQCSPKHRFVSDAYTSDRYLDKIVTIKS